MNQENYKLNAAHITDENHLSDIHHKADDSHRPDDSHKKDSVHKTDHKTDKEVSHKAKAAAKHRADLRRLDWILIGLRDGIPICLGYFAVAFALGIEAKNVGLTAFQSFLMSTGMVASAGEFAALLLIASNAGVFEMISTCLIVNLRYLLMSCSLSQKLSPKLPVIHRFGVAYCITDEIFGLSSAVHGYLEPFYTYAITIVSVAGWSGGTVMGVLVGNILPDAAVNALSVSLYGMFLAIIIPPAKEHHFIGGLVAVSMALSWAFGVLPLTSSISSGFKVILLTIVLAGAAALIRPVVDEDDADEEEKQPAQ